MDRDAEGSGGEQGGAGRDEEGMFKNAAMMKAAAPSTGGMSWPLEELATSTAPAFSGG